MDTEIVADAMETTMEDEELKEAVSGNEVVQEDQPETITKVTSQEDKDQMQKNLVFYSVIIKTKYHYTVGGIEDSHCWDKCVFSLRWAGVIIMQEAAEVGLDVSCLGYSMCACSSDVIMDMSISCLDKVLYGAYWPLEGALGLSWVHILVGLGHWQ